MRYFDDLTSALVAARALADRWCPNSGQRRSSYLVQHGSKIKVIHRYQNTQTIMMTVRPAPVSKARHFWTVRKK